MKLIDPFFFLMYFVRLRLTFNLRPNLEAKEYCEDQNLAKCLNGSLWAPGFCRMPILKNLCPADIGPH